MKPIPSLNNLSIFLGILLSLFVKTIPSLYTKGFFESLTPLMRTLDAFLPFFEKIGVILISPIFFEKRNKSYPQLTDHYFTGDYPVELVDELGDNKITQLSLLSSVSKV